MVALPYFDNFSTWDQNQKQNVNGAFESFAENIVENFLLPLRSFVCEDPTTDAHVIVLDTGLHTY
ncbi:hypothetical protein ACJ72_07915 [Emergomyces africanus]|uniref:Uncharacterized protein n=1 Tax=Emergomyces africanus TaxID=1955775 RepID=A0A1B7NLR6_9EURO|nr:hypothetical protein ACJ72_07915 [Emergomyces africanus]